MDLDLSTALNVLAAQLTSNLDYLTPSGQTLQAYPWPFKEPSRVPGNVRLIVDTNLFHECHSLVRPDFPWRAVGDFDTIDLIVSAPVMDELDRQKKVTRPRIKRRAVEAVSWFRELLQNGLDKKVLRESDPRVTLQIDVTLPSSAHPNVLDPSVADDRIVGVAASLSEADPAADVRLLTHDTGPVAKAKAIGLNYVFIPGSWIREPEEDDQQKEIQRLKDEIRHLKSVSPNLAVRVGGLEDNVVTLRRLAVASLTYDEVSALQESLNIKFPLPELQSGQGRWPHSFASLFGEPGGKGQFVPPSNAEIVHYQRVIYPGWIRSCLDRIEDVPRARNLVTPARSLEIILSNDGSRPAENLLIRFVARGPFLIAPPPQDESSAPCPLDLPPRPAPPSGYWLKDGERMVMGTITNPPLVTAFAGLSHRGAPYERDAEAFYYDPKRPDGPVDAFEMTCERLRHGLDPHVFIVDVFPQNEESEVKGAIEVQVSASNMSDIKELIVPIQVFTEFGPALSEAQRALNAFEFL
jgi:PIN domain